jgi:hypothetical protein
VNINITDTNSAAITSLHYEAPRARLDDATAEGTLTVTFSSSGTYVYRAVTIATMRQVLASPSLGSAIAKIVRPTHEFVKVA